MNVLRLTWLSAGLLGPPALALAQALTPNPLPLTALPPPATQRAVLGGPPQLPAEPATTLSALLRQLEQASSQPPGPATQVSLSLSVLRELAQQLADLRQQLAATQRLTAELLLEQTELTALRQQLDLLQSQQAAATNNRHFRTFSWSAD